MKRCIILATAAIMAPALLSAQKYEKVPYGDFEQWTVRLIKESDILGGDTVPLYVVGPRDTIVSNKTYNYNKSLWASSNALAQVMGITKVSSSVSPDKGPSGTCAKLETKLTKCKAIGIINVSALAQGSLYWGKVHEPITGTNDAEKKIDWGRPFTKRPVAFIFDYKAVIPNTGKLLKNNKEISGYDPEEAGLLLQKRWEDAQGNVHAKRVGTAIFNIKESSKGWVKGKRVPVIYGDASKDPSYTESMKLLNGDKVQFYVYNSKGEPKKLIEEGWANADEQPTHAIMEFTSGTQGTFCGALGNTLWIDNVKLEY